MTLFVIISGTAFEYMSYVNTVERAPCRQSVLFESFNHSCQFLSSSKVLVPSRDSNIMTTHSSSPIVESKSQHWICSGKLKLPASSKVEKEGISSDSHPATIEICRHLDNVMLSNKSTNSQFCSKMESYCPQIESVTWSY